MPEQQTEWFGKRLRELREASGLSQPQLAESAGLSKGGIADLEQGRRSPSWDTVLALAAALGVDCAAFQIEPSSETSPRGPGRPAKAARPAQDERTPDEDPVKPSGEKKPARGKGRKRKGG